jgi:hypothetical protein
MRADEGVTRTVCLRLVFRWWRRHVGGRYHPVTIGACAKTEMTGLYDLIGQRFGRLVVRERTPYRGMHAGVYWFCECDCGGNKEASTHSLRRGGVASCGCLRMSKSAKCNVTGCSTKAYCKGLCAKHYQRARRYNGDTSDRARITICAIEGCGRKVEAKGLCDKHYRRARRHDRNISDRPRIVRTCSVEGCDGEAITHGLCNKHYIRARKHHGDTSDRPRITICTIEGCGGKARTKGLCAKHYMRALRHDRNTSGGPLIVRTCSVEGCGGRVWGKGLCHKHYIRARKYNGDTSDRPRITICTIEGCGGKVYAKGFCRKHYERARRPRIVWTCSVEGCVGKVWAKGLCHKHYQRALRHRGETPIGHARITDSQTDQKARHAAGNRAPAPGSRCLHQQTMTPAGGREETRRWRGSRKYPTASRTRSTDAGAMWVHTFWLPSATTKWAPVAERALGRERDMPRKFNADACTDLAQYVAVVLRLRSELAKQITGTHHHPIASTHGQG